MAHTPQHTYEALMTLAYPLGFAIDCNWASDTFECYPRGLSRGGKFSINIQETSPQDAIASFRAFYNLSEDSDKPLRRDQRRRSRERVGRTSTSKEKSDGRKEAREETT